MIIPSRTFTGAKCWNLSYDGSNDYTALGSLTQIHSQSALTIMFWCRPASFGDWRGYFAKRESGLDWTPAIEIMAGGAGAGHNQGILYRVNGAADAYGYTGSILSANTWAHIACVFNGSGTGNSGRMQIYKDGVSQSLTFSGTIPASTGAPAGSAYIGWLSSSGSNFYYAGRLSNYLFFNRALSAGEIKYWMNRYLTGRENGLLRYFPHFDGTGTTLKDWSNNKSNGTISGATWVKGS